MANNETSNMDDKHNRSPHWDLMMATVKEVATRDESSVSRLEEEFLEEFGQLPTSELLDYFSDLLRHGSENEAEQELTPQSQPAPVKAKPVVPVEKKQPEKQPAAEKKVDPKVEFIDKMASNDQMTVLKFRKLFEMKFDVEPPIELIARFLKRLAYFREQASINTGNQDEETSEGFVKSYIAGKSPTVLKFRQEYEEKFGQPPTADIITFFLTELSKR